MKKPPAKKTKPRRSWGRIGASAKKAGACKCGAPAFFVSTSGRKWCRACLKKELLPDRNPARDLSGVRGSKAGALYQEFHGRPPVGTKNYQMPNDVRLPTMVDLGPLHEVVYEAQKEHYGGKKQKYVHVFGRGARVFSHPSGRGFLVIAGPFSVQARGIVG